MAFYEIKLYGSLTEKKQIFTGYVFADTKEEAIIKYRNKFVKLKREEWFDKLIKKVTKKRGS